VRGAPGPLLLRSPFIQPLDPSNLYGHLAATAVPGVEEWSGDAYRAVVALRHGPAVVAIGLPEAGEVPVELHLTDGLDEDEAVRRIRLAFDLDVDPAEVEQVLAADAVLAPLVAAAPGRRVPGTLDPEAMVLRAVLGQQVSTAAARTHSGRLAAAIGTPLERPSGGLTHLFPRAAALVAAPETVAEVVRMPRSRIRTLLAVAGALADGSVDLRAPATTVRDALLALPGVGPWTADTVLMRALGDADAFLPTDLGIVQAARRLGLPDAPRALEARSLAWSPYRAHAVQYLWTTGVHAVNTLPPGERPRGSDGGPARTSARGSDVAAHREHQGGDPDRGEPAGQREEGRPELQSGRALRGEQDAAGGRQEVVVHRAQPVRSGQRTDQGHDDRRDEEQRGHDRDPRG
jgi:AraC family transcriptional regulator of adaptative response / DNA-3-methyladenine glycosylase II